MRACELKRLVGQAGRIPVGQAARHAPALLAFKPQPGVAQQRLPALLQPAAAQAEQAMGWGVVERGSAEKQWVEHV